MSEIPADKMIRWQFCPNCDIRVSMRPYDIGSGPEMCCPNCETCWGANGQSLKPLDLTIVHAARAMAHAGKHGAPR